MKRFLKLLPCIAIAVLLACIALHPTEAHAAQYMGLIYEINEENGYAVITGGSNVSGDLVIPATIEGFPVAYIYDSNFMGEEGVFEGNKKLTSVTIPGSVVAIGPETFKNCTGLTTVIIENGVAGVGYRAFEGCTSLTSVTIPDSVTCIQDELFEGCTSLTNITIPNSVTHIYTNAFAGCTSLTSITIPGGVTSMGALVFYRCTSLTNVTISDGVTAIGEGMFVGCTSLTSITIPDGVTTIGEEAFNGCTSLTSITIPNSVTSIGYFAFSSCYNLTDVYYTGTQERWDAITAKYKAAADAIGDTGGQYLLSATLHLVDSCAEGHTFGEDAVCDTCGYTKLTADAITLDAANKLTVTDEETAHINHRAVIYFLGDETVEDITDEAALKAIDGDAKTHWGLAAINKLQLLENGNYVIQLHYNVGVSDKQTVAKAFTVNIVKPAIEMNGHKVVVTAGNAACANYRATVYALGDQTVADIYDEAALKAIDADAKTQWGLTAINKLQLPQNGNYVILLHYNVGSGAKQTVAKAVTIDNGEPTLQVENGKLIAADPQNAYIHHRAVVYYLGEGTSIENAVSAKTYWGLNSINKVSLTQSGNYVILLHYNLEGSVKMTTTLEVTI